MKIRDIYLYLRKLNGLIKYTMSGAIAIIALLKIVVTSYNIGVIAKNRIGKILKIISQIYMYLHKS